MQALLRRFTDLSGQDVAKMRSLHVNGQRAIPARYPNANPEIDLYCSPAQPPSVCISMSATIA